MGVVPYSTLADEAEDIDDEPWYCLQIDEFYCRDCNSIQEFLHLQLRKGHPRIVVFPEKDDPLLLDVATDWQKAQKNPRIVQYEIGFGTCVPIEDVRKHIDEYNKDTV